MKLTNYDWASDFPKEFCPALIVAVNQIAKKAIEIYSLEPMSPDSEAVLAQKSLQRIAALTTEELRAKDYYCGDDSTLSVVWSEAACLLEEPVDFLVFEGDCRVITVGEADGPYHCEHDEDGHRCNADTFSIYVSRDDLKDCPYESGPALIRFVVNSDYSKGKALCEKHAPQQVKDLVLPF